MLRWTTAGESHGRALMAVVEGMVAGVEVTVWPTFSVALAVMLCRPMAAPLVSQAYTHAPRVDVPLVCVALPRSVAPS